MHIIQSVRRAIGARRQPINVLNNLVVYGEIAMGYTPGTDDPVRIALDDNAYLDDYFGHVTRQLSNGGGTIGFLIIPRDAGYRRFTTGNPALDDYAGTRLIKIVVTEQPFWPQSSNVYLNRVRGCDTLRISGTTIEIVAIIDGVATQQTVDVDSISITTRGDVSVTFPQMG